MGTKKLKENNGIYFYKDDRFNTVSIKLNFLASSDNRSAAILDVLKMYLSLCNQVYKTDDDIYLRQRELYDLSLNFTVKCDGSQKIFSLSANLISMDVIHDDYSKEVFEFICDMLKRPDFSNEKMLEFAKRNLFSSIELTLMDYENYAENLYHQMVLPVENMLYGHTVDKEYIKELINSVTLDDLKNEYENIMNNFINGLVFGNISEDKFNEFVEYINLMPTNPNIDYFMDIDTKEGYIEVERDCEQSYIYVTYDFTDLTNAEYRVLEWMLNSSVGLCYQTLREKYGLVYGTHAKIFFHNKKMYIYGESDISKIDKFVDAVDEIIRGLNDREIVEYYMAQAKREIDNYEYSLEEDKTRLFDIINNRILHIYGDEDREVVNRKIEEMTPEDIMAKTKTLHRKNVFMIRSKDDE